MSPTRPVFPFSAIFGQESLKQALVLNAVDPSIGGALIRGDKGTAKSTAVRALSALLPAISVVSGCPYHCAPEDPPAACPSCAAALARGEARVPALRPVPLVELPVAATEDRVAGSFDLEAAIQQGQRRFEPGLLALANRGILYVDEVNLLPDHLVDVVLDAAAGGVHRVEREGVSIVHPARFVLVGTMNPEEGELRPQLLDRFGLAAEVTTPREPPDRAVIVRRRVAFDADPLAFAARWTGQDAEIGERIGAARRRLPAVGVGDDLLDLITRICVAYEVDGLRADIVVYKAAAALAALDGREAAGVGDVRQAAALALPHRRRRQPFDEAGFDPEPLDRLCAEWAAPPAGGGAGAGAGAGRTQGSQGAEGAAPPPPPPAVDARAQGPEEAGAAGAAASPDAVGAPAGSDVPVPQAEPEPEPEPEPAGPRGALAVPQPTALRPAARGRGGRATPGTPHGHLVGSVLPSGRVARLALDASLRAAAFGQRDGDVVGGLALRLRPADLREQVLAGRTGRLLLFVVDASGSMAARRRMTLARGVVRRILLDAYHRRDQVALIAFGGAGARLILPPTNSVDLAERRLAGLRSGGRTPLAAALLLAQQTLSRQRGGAKPVAPLVVLVSDGKANQASNGADPWTEALRAAGRLRRDGIAAAVVDADQGSARLGLIPALAEALGGTVIRPGGVPEVAAAVQRLAGGAPRAGRWVS